MSGILQTLLAGVGQAVYINSASFAVGSPVTINWPSGVNAGQLGIIIATGNTSAPTISGGAGGWSASTTSWSYGGVSIVEVVWSKVLNPSDLGGTVSVTISNTSNTGNVQCIAYSGVSALTVRNTAQSASALLSIAGFTKGASTKAIASQVNVRNGVPASVPSGFTRRYDANVGGSNIPGTWADIINPANYTSGTSVDWTVTSGFNQLGYVFELT